MMRRLWLLALLLCWAPFSQADVSAQLDRTQVALGDTVTLIIQATNGDDIGQPDLSALSQNFRVLGQSSSSNYQIVNGHMSSSKSLNIQLMPTHVGTLTIPALQTASGTTQPLQLNVSASGGNANNGGNNAGNSPHHNAQSLSSNNHNIFVQVSVNPKQVYMGQQATVTIKLYYAININNGSLDNLVIPGATVQPLGKSQNYATTLNGTSYQVYEQQYAIFPSKSGKLTIPSIAFQGQAMMSSMSNFFGMQVPGFGMPTPVTTASQPTTLSVLPMPADWKGQWLPARKVTLGMSGIPASSTLTVGTPLSLRLSISATGLPATSLPELSLPNIDNASVYGDKADSNTSQVGDLIKGDKSRTFAILPQHPGSLTIPATRLDWFNTTTGKRETITLPEHTFTVVAAAGATNAASAPVDTNATTPVGTLPSAQPLSADAHFWRLAFFASLGLWLLTLIGFAARAWRRRPRTPSPKATKKTSKRNLHLLFLQQVQQQDRQALTTLLTWATNERPAITSLPALKLALDDNQADATHRLEAWCYGHQSFPDMARDAFNKGLNWKDKTRGNADEASPLAELYPTDRNT